MEMKSCLSKHNWQNTHVNQQEWMTTNHQLTITTCIKLHFLLLTDINNSQPPKLGAPLACNCRHFSTHKLCSCPTKWHTYIKTCCLLGQLHTLCVLKWQQLHTKTYSEDLFPKCPLFGSLPVYTYSSSLTKSVLERVMSFQNAMLAEFNCTISTCTSELFITCI